MKSLFLSLFAISGLVLLYGCSDEGSSPEASSESAASSSSKVREGFTLTGPDSLSIRCQTAPRNMSSPSYGEASFQLEIMAGWIDTSAAAEGEATKSFGLGTLFVRFDVAEVGTYSLTRFDSEEGVRMRIDSIPDQGLSEDLRSISGELTFDQLEVGENRKPVKAAGSFTGEFALGRTKQVLPISGTFAVGLKD